jgi:hypothetical protein
LWNPSASIAALPEIAATMNFITAMAELPIRVRVDFAHGTRSSTRGMAFSLASYSGRQTKRRSSSIPYGIAVSIAAANSGIVMKTIQYQLRRKKCGAFDLF